MNLLQNLTHHIRADEDIRAAFLVGSRARSDCPADEYSDIDIIAITTQPERYLASDNWLASIGTPRISFIEDTVLGDKERRILFEGGADLDFLVFTGEQVPRIQNGELDGMLARGYVLIKDELGLAQILEEAHRRANTQDAPALTQDEFANMAQDFWFHAVWTAKKMARGELLYAKHCLDVYMKERLLALIEQHPGAWYNGRFIERWAQPWVLEGLAAAYARYDLPDMKRALLATMDLFRGLTAELEYTCPKDAEAFAYGTVLDLLEIGRAVLA